MLQNFEQSRRQMVTISQSAPVLHRKYTDLIYTASFGSFYRFLRRHTKVLRPKEDTNINFTISLRGKIAETLYSPNR